MAGPNEVWLKEIWMNGYVMGRQSGLLESRNELQAG